MSFAPPKSKASGITPNAQTSHQTSKRGELLSSVLADFAMKTQAKAHQRVKPNGGQDEPGYMATKVDEGGPNRGPLTEGPGKPHAGPVRATAVAVKPAPAGPAAGGVVSPKAPVDGAEPHKALPKKKPSFVRPKRQAAKAPAGNPVGGGAQGLTSGGMGC